MSELLYQVQQYLSFFWASGGLVHDFTSHNIDECCWMKGSWPVRAQGSAGRYYRGDEVDQNLDHYSVRSWAAWPATPARSSPGTRRSTMTTSSRPGSTP